jgi:hypothetical protein
MCERDISAVYTASRTDASSPRGFSQMNTLGLLTGGGKEDAIFREDKADLFALGKAAC